MAAPGNTAAVPARQRFTAVRSSEKWPQRLDREKLDWMVRKFPALGWQEMDPRLYTPKPVPGVDEKHGFRYDPIRRNLKLEAIFHFGPEKGNGTLVEDAFWLDEDRVLTVNRGSDNLSLVDVNIPDLECTFEASQGIAAFEINHQAGEIYLIEKGARGMLVFSLDGGAVPVDTMMLDFAPGAVLQDPGSRYLFFTDESNEGLRRIDLTGEKETSYLMVDLHPPLFMAAHTASGTLVLVSQPGRAGASGGHGQFYPAARPPQRGQAGHQPGSQR